MIGHCLGYLETVCKDRNILAYTQAIDVSKHQGKQWAIIEILDIQYTRDGSLVAKEDDLVAMLRTYRRRVHKVILRTKVQINTRSAQAAVIAEQIIQDLERRIWDDDHNAILITARVSQPEEDPSMLQGRSATDLLVDFAGGIYQDRTVPLLDLETAQETAEED
ncbi:MAG: hypothetical protein U1D96_05380 [Eubacteriales bacterium]|nr:hypothetical protein [Eubacteriales bacterium]